MGKIKIKIVDDEGKEVSNFNELLLKNSIQLTIAGFLYEDGDIMVIPSLLHEMYEDYRDEIKKQIHEDCACCTLDHPAPYTCDHCHPDPQQNPDTGRYTVC